MDIIQSKIKLPWYTIEVLEDRMISLYVDENYGFASKDDIKDLIKDLQTAVSK